MMKSITYNQYLDSVYGGWFGKCLGGSAGAPVEGIKKLLEIEDFSSIMQPELPNDDLDLQLLWLEVLEQKGSTLTSFDLAEGWLEKCWYPFNEYGYFLKNFRRGILPPYSGSFNNAYYNEGEGCPIRSEIWGFVFPGRPEQAAQFAFQDGILDHTTNSVWAEQMLAVMESMVFFEQDILKLLEIGLTFIPFDCKLARCVRLVIDYYHQHPQDWQGARNQVLTKFGHPDFTNSVQNQGFVVIALLYGNGDLRQSLTIGINCGYDTDSTCATIGAILGSITGYSKISHDLTNLIKDKFVVGINVQRRSDSLYDLAQDTCRVGVSLIINSDHLEVRVEETPEKFKPWNWLPQYKATELKLTYKELPGIGPDKPLEFVLEVKNNDLLEPLEGSVEFRDIPQGWIIQSKKMNFWVGSNKSIYLPNTLTITTPSKGLELANTNILQAVLLDNSGNEFGFQRFGVAGASLWKVYGPFFDPLEVQENLAYPTAHGPNSNLPPVEAMANNAVHLNKEYLPEQPLNLHSYPAHLLVSALEDLIPIEDYFSNVGQSCFYLEQTLISPAPREVWVVIGNNDGYRLWVNGELIQEKDEFRFWTPFNNYSLIKLHEGSNTITLKLLRRTEKILFSLGLRRYEGKHWHRNEWYTDFISKGA